MKTMMTVSIDVAVAAEAKQRISNISQFCELAMKEALNIKDGIPKNIDEANKKIAAKTAEIAELRQKIAEIEKKNEDNKVLRVLGG